MPFVATWPAPSGEQQARLSEPQLLQVWVSTARLALPVPAMVQSVPHPSQRWRATSLVVWPVRVLAPEPLGLKSGCATQVFLHFGQAMAGTVAETGFLLAFRSSNMARNLGEAVIPSSPVGLY